MKGNFFKCNCGSEGLWVEHDYGFGTEFSLFQTDPQNRSFKNRLILAWECLKGKPYANMVLLDDQSLADLVDQLLNIQNRNHAEENYKETVFAAADKLCGLSCGTAVDSIIEYVKRPDCSQAQIERLITELTKLQ